MRQLDVLIGIRPEQWGQHYNTLSDLDFKVLADEPGQNYSSTAIDGRSEFPWTVSTAQGRFAVLDAAAQNAVTAQTTSKPLEQRFSPVASNCRRKGLSSPQAINQYLFLNAWKRAGHKPLDVTRKEYEAAEELAQHPDMLDIFNPDISKREFMSKAYAKQEMTARIKGGAAWTKNNHDGNGRTKKYSKSSVNSKATAREKSLLGRLCKRVGQGSPPSVLAAGSKRKNP